VSQSASDPIGTACPPLSSAPAVKTEPSAEPAPLPWLLWGLVLLTITSGTRNPFLLGLALAILWPVGVCLNAAPSLRLTLTLTGLAALWNFLMVRAGETVLFTLPTGWPLLGGPYTMEAALYGALNGLALAVILNGFRMLTLRLSPRELIRLSPPALYEAGLVLSIALAFLPQSRQTLDDIRQAQAVRGHRIRGLRDLLPLLLPLLITSLEQALALAEALSARGFTARRELPTRRTRGLLAAGLLCLALGAAIRMLAVPAWIGPLSLSAGALLTLAGLREAGRLAARPRLTHAPLTPADWTAGGSAAAALAGWILLQTLAPDWLAYPVYPHLTPPQLALPATLPILILILPALAPRSIATPPHRPPSPAISATLPAINPPAIVFQQVTFSYPHTARPILKDINLTLSPGAFVLLTGPSGSGKSTLLRCINGLVPQSSGGRIAGRVHVGPHTPFTNGPAALAAHIGFVIQNPVAGFVTDTVADEVAFALENALFPPALIAARITEVLAWTGLSELRHRRLDQLSGGEQQRVAIAAALALRPPILLLDEPLSQLDPAAAAELIACLQRLHAAGLTIVVAEHRLERLLPIATQVVYLPGDGTFWSAEPTAAAARLPAPPAIVQLGRKLGWEPLPLSVETARPYFDLKKEAVSSWPLQTATKKQPLKSRQPLLEIQSLHVTLDKCPILPEINLTLYPGELTVLLGHNGAGKTTLLRTIAGLIPAQTGDIRLAGEEITTWEVAARCRRLGYLPQEPDMLLFAETTSEELAVTLRNHNLPIDERLADMLNRLGLTTYAAAYPRDLSVGERQRVALGAVTITRPPLLLLDEPTRGLDMLCKMAFGELLVEWKNEGLGILLVTHDMEWAIQFADRIVILEKGKILADGEPYEILASHPDFAPQIIQLTLKKHRPGN